MSETINDKLKKLITKVNSIQGSLLSMGKRLTALEEKPIIESEFEGDKQLLFRIAEYLGSAVGYTKDEDTVQDVGLGEETTPESETEEVVTEPEDEIDQETLDALDEVIEDG